MIKREAMLLFFYCGDMRVAVGSSPYDGFNLREDTWVLPYGDFNSERIFTYSPVLPYMLSELRVL
jgi:hypothetical protein